MLRVTEIRVRIVVHDHSSLIGEIYSIVHFDIISIRKIILNLQTFFVGLGH